MGWPWILKHSCCLFFVDLRPPAHVGAQPVMAALPPNEAEEWLKKAVRTDAQGGGGGYRSGHRCGTAAAANTEATLAAKEPRGALVESTEPGLSKE